MGRIVKDWQPDLVEATAVAPHRYTWDDPDSGNYDTPREARAGAKYKPGEVVYVESNGQAVKARVLMLFAEYVERYGEYREKYRVQFATAAGTWSKLWVYTYPGPIQRGYCLAGLAPDCEGKL